MKIMKRLTCVVLALTLALGVFIVPSTSVEAKSKKSKTQTMKMHVNVNPDTWVGLTYYYKNAGDTIKAKSLKSSSKDLVVKQTYQKDVSELMQYVPYTTTYPDGSQYNSEGQFYDELTKTYLFINTPSRTNSYAELDMWVKKAGTYTVSFDVVGADGKKRYTQKVTVVADDKQAVASISFAGKKLNVSNTSSDRIYTTKKKGKINVKMNKGYKLKRIEYLVGQEQRVDAYGDPYTVNIWQQVKNNKKISLPTVLNTEGDNDSSDKLAAGTNKEDTWYTGVPDAEGSKYKKYLYSYWRKTFAKNATTVRVYYKDTAYAASYGYKDYYTRVSFDITRLGK